MQAFRPWWQSAVLVIPFLGCRRARGCLAALRDSLNESSSAGAEPQIELPQDEVEVVTYNLLSSHLSLPSYYWHNSREDLDPQSRLQKVRRKLEPLLARGAIICLQECSTLWAGQLTVFFHKHNYHFVYSSFGGTASGYMGVGIAFPYKNFHTVGSCIQRVSEAKSWPQPEDKARRPSNGSGGPGLLQQLLDFVGYVGSPFLLDRTSDGGDDDQERGAVNPWEYSRSRQNTLVAVKLKHRKAVDSKPFTVATYHMPCAFWNAKVMVIHTALAAQCAQRFASGSPLILAGDWNFRPGAAPYQLLSTGSLPEAHPAHPGYLEGDSWRLEGAPADGSKLEGFRSAYAERNPGGEPEFTNYAWTRDQSDPFIGTLDYIWLSKDAEVLSVGPLPTTRNIMEPLPSKDEPSDHLLLNARLRPHGRSSTQDSVLSAARASSGLTRQGPAPVRLNTASSSSVTRGLGFGSAKGLTRASKFRSESRGTSGASSSSAAAVAGVQDTAGLGGDWEVIRDRTGHADLLAGEKAVLAASGRPAAPSPQGRSSGSGQGGGRLDSPMFGGADVDAARGPVFDFSV